MLLLPENKVKSQRIVREHLSDLCEGGVCVFRTDEFSLPHAVQVTLSGGKLVISPETTMNDPSVPRMFKDEVRRHPNFPR
jgi:hypothetical protein